MILHVKLIIFEAILMPIHIPGTRFLHFFFSFFFDLKIVRDICASKNMNGDFGADLFL